MQAENIEETIGDVIPDVSDVSVWIVPLGRVAIAVLVALVIHWCLFWVLKRAAAKTETSVDDTIVARVKNPARLGMALLGLLFALHLGEEASQVAEVLGRVVSLGFIAAATWLIASMVSGVEQIVLSSHDMDESDNREARRMHTQLRVVTRTLVFIIVVVGVAAMLMTFPRIRQVGWSLLASAGLAGLVLGMAARPTLENLIAGLQIAFTQPITLDDVVIINGEWGRIEEITTTYVVVRIWDERRLIVPFSKVLSEPFQNWTRKTADILGTVYLHLDYTVPVQKIREELERFVKDHDKWDGRVAGLQVTGATERTLELRGLVSAADASKAWDLRCDLREHLIGFVQREYPDALPREREIKIE